MDDDALSAAMKKWVENAHAKRNGAGGNAPFDTGDDVASNAGDIDIDNADNVAYDTINVSNVDDVDNVDDVNDVVNNVNGSKSDGNNDDSNDYADANDDSRDKNPAATFNTDDFLKGLDEIFDAHEGATKAEPYLLQAMTDAENAGDDAGLLTVLNEAMGFYRSQGRHDDNQWIVQRTLELALRMRLEGTEAWTTTLINCATSMRAAAQYDQAEDLYRQAIDSARTTLKPTDRRMAALHNNLSMLYSETGRADDAERELRKALQILEAASTDATRDIDIAATHTNLALILLDRINAMAKQRSDHSPDHDADASAAAQKHAPEQTNATKPNATNPNATNPSADLIRQLLDDAMRHAALSLEIYRNAGQEHAGHYASALAGYAQVCLAAGRADEAVERYRQSLAVIEENYGQDNDYYRITAANLVHAEQAAEQNAEQTTKQNAEQNATKQISKQDGADEQLVKETSSGEMSSGDKPAGTTFTEKTSAEKQPSEKTPVNDQTLASNPADSNPANAASQQPSLNSGSPTSTSPENASSASPAAHTATPDISGLQLAQAYWKEYGKPLIEERYPEYRGRIAAGLVGHGSECYGFDDEISHDHDFGPGFCLWLTDEDYAAIGTQLQADYDALPQTFMGFGPRESTPRAQGGGKRVGVFSIGDFFESITGYRQAPPDDQPYQWLMLDEATLAAATNGKVFADPLGAFSKTRQGFTLMPDDVRLSLISRRLGMIAQAGQYNLPRMLERGDGAAAWCSINEFVEATASLVFLINRPVTVGYMPYYKWRFAALRKLSRRMGMRLTDICEQLETILQLSSAACFGGAGFGEGGKGSTPAAEKITNTVESICSEIVAELKAEGLTTNDETFLEWQRPYVEAHIERRDPCLISV